MEWREKMQQNGGRIRTKQRHTQWLIKINTLNAREVEDKASNIIDLALFFKKGRKKNALNILKGFIWEIIEYIFNVIICVREFKQTFFLFQVFFIQTNVFILFAAMLLVVYRSEMKYFDIFIILM